GTVFQFTTAAGHSIGKLLYGFLEGADGDTPVAGLIRDPHGILFGTTFLGGGSGNGTVFALTPPLPHKTWTEQVLDRFAGGAADGANPQSALLMDGADLYGTSWLGGSSGFGTVFALTPPTAGGAEWNEKLLYSFKGGTDGAYPLAGTLRVANDES